MSKAAIALQNSAVRNQNNQQQQQQRVASYYRVVVNLLLVATVALHRFDIREQLQIVRRRVEEVLPDGVAATSSQQSSPPVHVLFGLAGNEDGFFAEFEVALKSVLLNAPHHASLEIHILADDDAQHRLRNDVWRRLFFRDDDILNQNRTVITSRIWYTNVKITTYNVEPFLVQWNEQIRKTTNQSPNLYHTIGAYFRLLSYHVLPPHVTRIFYLDTDVVVMANLAQVMEEAPADDDWFFQMQAWCSGVMLINVPKLPSFWDLVSQVDYTGRDVIDQDVILGVRDKFVNASSPKPLIRTIGQPWDLVFTRDYFHLTPEKLFQYRPQVGVVHYNGGGASTNAYFQDNPIFIHQNKREGWGIGGSYFIHLPWSWVFYMGQSASAGGSSRHRIRIVDNNQLQSLRASNKQ